MKKVKILIPGLLVVILSVVAMPVMAIGPFQAYEVGNNKNLGPFGAAVANLRGGAAGSIYWFWVEADQHWIRYQYQDAQQAKGLMDNAIVAQYSGPPDGMSAYFATLMDTSYDNTWIYLSGDGAQYPGQFMGHGMLYWYSFGSARRAGATVAQAQAFAASIVATYPAGEIWRHNDIPAK